MRTKVSRIVFLSVALVGFGGCAATPQFDVDRHLTGRAAATDPADDIRTLPMFAGRSGRAMSWGDLLEAVDWADIVFLGEQHDDLTAHAVQRAVVADAFPRWQPSALSMEMLERDEQTLVSDYFEGIIDAERFAKLTDSEKWGGDASWHDTYHPIIDAARTSGGRVVAANAPRRYVRLARLEGYGRLAALPSPRREMFDYPARLPAGHYRDRFWSVMQEAGRPEASNGDEPPHVLGDAEIEALFRSQLVWDTTMAASIAKAHHLGAKKVVHLIGQFHTDFDGGTVQQLRKRLPNARVLVVSLQPAYTQSLLPDDRDRADVVVYTGARPEPAASQPAE